MNKLQVINILFYISPYLAMIVHDMSKHIPESIQNSLLLIYLGGSGFLLMYALPINKWLIYKFIPSYLLFFYVFCWTGLCIILLTLKGNNAQINGLKAITISFLIMYVSSFFWEIPENIYWLIKRGWHSAILLHLLGAFPYIWLDGRRKWKKNPSNLSFLALSWGFTALGLLIFQSSMHMVYHPSSWAPNLTLIAWYFLICRVMAVLTLSMWFVWGSPQKFIGWMKCLKHVM